MDETDYQELLEYIIEQLEEKQAYDVVNQIKEVSSSKVTVDITNNEDFRKLQKEVEDFTEISPKSDYSHIGKTRLRNLTHKEIFSEAVEILTNYLQTTPKMANTISVLFKTSPKNIGWKLDKEETFSKDRIDLLSFMLAVTNEEAKINEYLSLLKTEATNRGELK